MIRETLVMEESKISFRNKVNKLLDQGWRVGPNGVEIKSFGGNSLIFCVLVKGDQAYHREYDGDE